MKAYKAQLYVRLYVYLTVESLLLSGGYGTTRIPQYTSLFNRRGFGESKIWSIAQVVCKVDPKAHRTNQIVIFPPSVGIGLGCWPAATRAASSSALLTFFF